MRVEYTTAAASLQDRARLIADRSRAVADVGGIDASVRNQFAATLAPLLQSADDAVLRVSVDGPDAQILVVEGRSSPTHLAELRSEEHTSELQSREKLVCRLLLENKNK